MARLRPLTTTPEARAVRSGVTRLIAVTAATAQYPAYARPQTKRVASSTT